MRLAKQQAKTVLSLRPTYSNPQIHKYLYIERGERGGGLNMYTFYQASKDFLTLKNMGLN